MTIKEKSYMCSKHGIPNHKGTNGRLYAMEVYTQDGQTQSKWVDVTGWKEERLKKWLGY
jgi:hypothetical protein